MVTEFLSIITIYNHHHIFLAVGLHVIVHTAFLNGPESFNSIWISAIMDRYSHIRCYMHVS